MSDIEKLELLIQKEQQRSGELEEEIKHERRLLEETENMRRGNHEKDIARSTGDVEREKYEKRTETDWNQEMESKNIGCKCMS